MNINENNNNENNVNNINSYDIILLMTTGIIWGSSNFLIQIIPYYSLENILNNNRIFKYLYYITFNFPFVLVYLYDKLASITFFISLGRKSLNVSDVVLYCNGLSIIFSYFIEYFYFKWKHIHSIDINNECIDKDNDNVNQNQSKNLNKNQSLTKIEKEKQKLSDSTINDKVKELEDKYLIISIFLILLGAFLIKS